MPTEKRLLKADRLLKATYDKGYREGYEKGLADGFDIYASRD